jgi:PAS domain S-box-containing protein
MTKDYLAICNDASIEDAATLFLKRGLQRVPVVDSEGKTVGMIATNSFLIAMVAGIDMNTPVREVMTKTFSTIDESAPLKKLYSYPVEPLLVVTAEGKLAGVLTKADMDRIVGEKCWLHNQQLKEIFNAIPTGLLVVNTEGVVTLCNSFTEKLLGCQYEDALGRHLSEIVDKPLLLGVLETGKPEKGGKEVINGITVLRNRFPVNKDGVVAGAIEVFQNISDLETIAHELHCVKALSHELEGIIESSYDGIVVTDNEGKLLRISRSYSRIAGIPWEDLIRYIGCNMRDIESGGKVSNSVSLLVLDQKKTVTINQRILNGKELMVTGNPIFDEEGKIVRVVCNIRDISMLNKLKREIEENKEAAARYCGELEELRARNLQLDGIVAQSPEMKRAVDLAVRVASVNSTVLITGETGTGKEVIAKIIHKAGRRNDQPFITVNCGAIPETLLESELFGYDKGAFTGANREGKLGLLEVANNGTVFLDEIGDLPLLLQVKLLRVLQEQEISRVGGTKTIKLNLRILAATNKDLSQMVKEKTFREDFFYRLNVIPIHMPPLRERREDILPLVLYFLDKYSEKYNMKKRFSAEVLDTFEQYMWPGNVRELENLIERVLVISDGETIKARHLPGYMTGRGELRSIPITVHNIMPLKEAGEIVEKELLSKVLSTGRSTRKAASILGVDHSTIVRKINKYSLIINKGK